MATLRVEIVEEKDLSVLEKVLTELGLKFSVDQDEYVFETLSHAAIQGIQEGLTDMRDGRVSTHELAQARFDKKIGEMRAKYAGN